MDGRLQFWIRLTGDIRNLLEYDEFNAVNLYFDEYTDSTGDMRNLLVSDDSTESNFGLSEYINSTGDIRNLLEYQRINGPNFGLVNHTDAKGEERPMSCGISVKYFPNVLSSLENPILDYPPSSPDRTRKCPCICSPAMASCLWSWAASPEPRHARAPSLDLSLSFFRQKPCAHEHLLPMNEET